jgi:predicted KAP-like P-loop ATPase
MRLFFFLKNTAFVIAADTSMIKHAVRKHFDGVDDALVTSYFDKLIQVPIRVPPLGTQEVRAYMMLLFVENSTLKEEVKESIRERVCQQLSKSWRGARVDRSFMETLHEGIPSELVERFDAADRLAPVMTTASQIAGNPRLIKRFLNALAIRMTISHTHGVGVDEAALAKMLLFERCGDPKAYEVLTKAVNEDNEGKPRFLTEWEQKALAGEELKLEEPWNNNFVREWLTLPPCLADRDLRGVLYVSREHAPLITPKDRLSSEAAKLLTALLEHPAMGGDLRDRLTSVPHLEMSIILDHLLDQARQVQEWGVPPILEACLAVTRADGSLGTRLAAFLGELPPTQITASIVPKIGSEPWAGKVFTKWESTSVSSPVKRAIKHQKENGNISI